MTDPEKEGEFLLGRNFPENYGFGEYGLRHAEAMAAIPSFLPVKPSPSVEVPFTFTASLEIPRASAIFTSIAGE